MKTFRLKLIIVLTLMVVLSILCSPFAGAVSYSRWNDPKGDDSAVASREVFTASRTITADSLGLDDSLVGLTDVFCGADGTVYILCGGKSRLVVLNKDYTFLKEITILDDQGNEVDFTGASGGYADKDGTLYIADTDNRRILITDAGGKLLTTIKVPNSKVIPEGFIFAPKSIARDSRGYMYVLSTGSYYGALLYSPDNTFLGFFGANKVKASVMDSLSILWDLLTNNDTKQSGAAKKVPYSFSDLCIDQEDYVVTSSGKTKTGWSKETGQIRRLSPGGTNILIRKNADDTIVDATGYNFAESEIAQYNGAARVQDFIAVDTDRYGNIYALDLTYGFVYVYDSDCNLLTAFGGGFSSGNYIGVFNTAVSLCVNNDSVLVADSENRSVTVFDLTEYGSLLYQAQNMYHSGNYAEAEPVWRQILALNGNCQQAYLGLAKAAYIKQDYKQALYYSEKGMDYHTYDLSRQYLRKDFTSRNFFWIFPLCVLAIGGLIAFLIIKAKKRLVLIKNTRIQSMLSVWSHPFKAYTAVKYEGRGSMLWAVALSFMFWLCRIIQDTSCGLLFKKETMKSYNAVYTLAMTVGIVILWTIANYGVCTLFSGKGKIKDIFIVTAYALQPLIAYSLIYTLLSHMLTMSEFSFLNSLYIAVLIFTLILLSIGIMTVQEYNFFKFIGTSLLSLIAMILIVFIGFVLIILLQQFGNFAYAIYMEAIYR